jgi:hypothetical protein
MTDLKQEVADVAAATEKIHVQTAAPGKVRFRHPNSGDIKDVDAIPEAMIPIMGLGYQQVKE